MEENKNPGQQLYQEPATAGSSESLDDSSLVSSFASLPQSNYQVDNMLEVHDQGNHPSPINPASARKAVSAFSKRKALIVSVAITIAVTLFTGASALFLGKNAPKQPNNSVSSTVPVQDIGLENEDAAELPPELLGAKESLLVTGDVITRGDLKFSNNSFVSVLRSTQLTASQTLTLPDTSGTLCLDSNNCNYANLGQLGQLDARLAQLGQQLNNFTVTANSGVTSINNQTGTVSIQGSTNQINVSTAGGTITFSTPQNLDANANVQFGNLTLGTGGSVRTNNLQQTAAGNNIAVNAGADSIVFTAGGRTFTFPASGPASQTICTDGISCASGGGQAVILSPTSVQNDTSADASIFLNDTGGGNLIQVQSLGIDRLVVDNVGNTSVAGSLTVASLGNGFVRSTGGLLSVVSAIDLASSDVTNTLPVNRGGTGSANLTANGVLVGNGTSPVSSVTAGGTGLCLVSNAGAPSFQTCPGVSDVNGLSGSVSLQGTANRVSVTTGVGTITFSTPQDINTTSSPTFAALTLTGLSDGVMRASSGVLTTGLVSLTSEVSGTLPIGSGGTGLAGTPTNGQLLIGNGTNYTLAALTQGAGIAITNGSGSITIASAFGASIDLGTETTGDYVGGVNGGAGVNVTGSGGANSTPSIALVLQADKGLEVDGSGLSLIDCAANQILKYNVSNQWVCAADVDTTGSFNVAGDSGTPENVTNGDTLTIQGGNNIATTVGATDAITIATVNNPTFTTSVTTPLLQSSGALSITPNGAMTVGATGQTALLQGSTTTITSNGAGNDIVLTSADDIRLTGFDCSVLGNGGKLTTDASGNLSCAADNSADPNAITGTGTANRLALFSGAQAIADSWLLQNGSTLELDNTRNLSLTGGNFSVTGTGLFTGLITSNGGITVETGDTFTFNGDAFTDLTGTGLQLSSGSLQTTLGTSVDLTTEVTGILPVTNGGTGVNGSTAANGTLLIGNGTGYTLATLTAGSGITVNNGAGSIEIVNFFGTSIESGEITDLTITGADIANDTIALGTKTTGNYVATISGNSQVSVSGSGSETAAITLSLVGDSIGDAQLAFDTGQNLTATSNPTFNGLTLSGNLTVEGGNTTIGTTTQAGTLTLSDGSSNTGALQTASLGQDTTFTLPDPGAASATICLSTGNCAGSGGGVTTAGGTANRVAIFNGAQTIADSWLLQNGSTMQLDNTRNFELIGGNLTLTSGNLGVTGNQTTSGSVTFSALANGFLEVNGSGLVSVGTIDLGGDTSGNYVATITAGNGISGSSNSEGGTPTIALGNLTADWVQSGAFDVVLGDAGAELRILESAGGTFYGTFDVGDLSADEAYTFLQGGTVVTSGNVTSFATTAVTAGNGLTGGGTTGALTLDIGAGNGITVNANDIAVIYGSAANTAVQGNTSITVSAGTNLTGGGSITLGAGGSVTLDVSNSPTFSGTVTVQGSSVSIGTASTTTGLLNLYNISSTFAGSVQVASLGQATLYTLPDPGAAGASICLSTGNCAGSGGGVTTAGGTTNQLAKFSGAQTIADSTISDNGTNVTTTVDIIIQGGDATLGTAAQAGTLTISDGTNNTATIAVAAHSGNFTYTIPDAGANDEICIKALQNCAGAGGGNAPNSAQYLTLALDGGLTSERTLSFNGTNFSVSDGGANGAYTVNTAQNIDTAAAPSFAGLTLTSNLNMNANTIQGTTAVIDFTNFDVASNGNVTAGTYNGQTISATASFTGTVTVAGLTTLNGGLTVEVGDTFTFNGDGFTDLTGNGLQISTGVLTLNVQANKGLEVDGSGLSLIDCGTDDYILKYDTGAGQWYCAPDAGGSGVGDDVQVGGVDAAGANFLDTTASASVAGIDIALNTVPAIDEISLTISDASGTLAGIVTANAQTFGGAKTFNGQIVAGAGINLGSQTLSGTTAVIDFNNFDVSGAGAVTAVGVNAGSGLLQGTGGLTVSSTVTLSSLTNGFLEVNGSGVVSVGTIDLGTDTAGNYVATITAGNGISGSSSTPGGTPTIALSNLTADWIQSGAFDISLANASSELKIMESTGGTFYAIFDAADLSADQTFVLNEGGTVVTSGNVGTYATTAVTAGSGLTGGGTTGGLTLNIGAGNGVTVNANDITLALQANKGLEVDSNGLSLIDCVSDGYVLKYSTGTGTWGCAADAGASGTGDDISVNGTGADNANFINTTATGTVAGVTWSLNGAAAPDEISVSVGNASATEAGAVTTGAQTFAGAKTFNGQIIAGAGIDIGTQTLQGTTAVINFTNFDVDASGNTLIGGTLNVTGATTLTSTLAVQGATISLGGAAQQGTLVVNDGSGQTGSLSVANLAANRTYTLPEYTSGTGTICLDSGNCAGSGGGVSTSGGTTNRVAKFTGSQAIGDSSISDNGTLVSILGSTDLSVLGGDITLGTTSGAGSIVLHDGDGQTTTVSAGNSVGNLAFVLPTTVGTNGQCVKNSATPGVLTFSNCNNGSGAGGSITLQDAYDAGNTITTTDNRNITFTFADTATDSAFLVNLQCTTCSASGGRFAVQNGGTDVFTVSPNSGGTLVKVASTAAFQVQNTSNNEVLTVNTSANEVRLGKASTVNGRLVFNNSTNANTVAIVPATISASYTLNLPNVAAGTYDICTSSGNCVGGGGGGAPNAAAYITIGNDATLSNERAITAGTNISFTDGGANSTYTISTVNNPTFSTSVTTPTLTSTGALGITSATTSAVTLDSGTIGDVNVGTGANAKTVTIGTTNTTSTLVLQAGSGGITLNASTLTRTAAGTTTLNLVDGANTTLSLTNSGAGVASLSVDGNGSFGGTGTIGGTLNVGGATQTFTGASGTITSSITGTISTPSSPITVTTGGTIGSTSNSGSLTLSTGAALTSGNTGGITILSGNATSGTAGNVSIDAGTSSTGNGSVLLGAAARAQTVTVGNTTGTTTLTLQAGSGGIVLGSGTLRRTAAGTTNLDLIDVSATTFAIQNSGAGVANLTLDGAATIAGDIAVNGGDITSSAGTLNVNTSGSGNTSIGTGAGILVLNGGGVQLNTGIFQRQGAGALSFDLQDAANTTLSLNNSGAGVANLTVDGTGTFSGATVTVGAAALQGSYVINDGDAETVTITIDDVAANSTIKIPDAVSASDTFCLLTLNNCAGSAFTLQQSYNADADGSDAIIAMTTADGSLIFRNPAAGGSASGYAVGIEQLATGAVGGLMVTNAGTSNSFRVNDDGTTTDASPFIIDQAGRVGIGLTVATYKLDVYEGSAATSGSNTGSRFTLEVVPASAPGVNTSFSAASSAALVTGANVNSDTTVTGYLGIVNSSSSGTLGAANGLYGQIFSSGNITNATGVIGRVFNTGTGTFTSAYGIQAQSPVFLGAGAITTAYGMYIDSQEVAGVGTGYGLYQVGSSDDNYFAGRVGIGTASPARALEVSAGDNVARFTSSGANAFIELKNSGSGGNISSVSSTGDDIGLWTSGSKRLTINSSGNTTLTGTLAIQGASATIGAAALQGSLILNDGNGGQTATIQVGNIAANTVLTIPSTLSASDTFCFVTLNNCVGSGVTAMGALDGQAKNSNGATIAAQTLYLQSADGSNPGVVTTGAQSFGGAKTFNSSVAIATNLTVDTNTLVVDSTNDRVGIGTAAPEFKLHAVTDGAATYITGESYSASGGTIFQGRAAGGTLASPTALTSGNLIAQLGARGYDGTGFTGTRAAITLNAESNWSGTDNGTGIHFFTTTNGTTALLERMSLTNDGKLGLGTTTPQSKLHVMTDGGPSFVTNTAYGGGTVFEGERANGTLASPTALVAGNTIAQFSARGYDGAAFSSAQGAILMYAAQNWNATDKGTSLGFSTTENGTTSLTQKMTLFHNGNLGLGDISPSEGRLVVDTVSAANIGVVVRGVAAQTGDLLQLRDNTDAVVAKFMADGTALFGSAANCGTTSTLICIDESRIELKNVGGNNSTQIIQNSNGPLEFSNGPNSGTTFAGVLVKGDKTTAFQIQNGSSQSIFTADTVNSQLLTSNISPLTAASTSTNKVTAIASTNNVGYYTNVKIGKDGFARIVYYDVTGGDLEYVRCTNYDCTTSTTTTIDSTGDVGLDAKIAIGSDGFARIAYQDATNTSVKYAVCNDDNCSAPSVNTVDNSATDTGARVNLALNSSNLARMTYYQYNSTGPVGALRYAECTADVCTSGTANFTNIDATVAGSYSAVTLGADGFARIAYAENNNNDLAYVRCLNAACSSTSTPVIIDATADNTGYVYGIILDRQGNAMIPYFDNTGLDLEFIRCNDVDCTSRTATTLDSTGSTGSYNSVVLGADGFARIAYYDFTNKNLRYVTCQSIDCATNSLSTLEGTGTPVDVGSDTSIAIRPDGRTVITYYDITNGDIRMMQPTYSEGLTIGGASNRFARLFVADAEVTSTLRIGDTTNGINFSASNGFRLSGSARNSNTATLKPEFEGAVFSNRDPSNTALTSATGTLTSAFCSNTGALTVNSASCATSGENHSYYEWTHNETTDQEYYIYVRYRIPDNFDSAEAFSNHAAIRGYSSKSAASADNVVTLALYNDRGAQCGSTTSITNGTANQWGSGVVIGSISGDGDCEDIDAGEYVTFAIRMKANSTGTTGEIIRMGEIEFSYKSTY